MELHEKLQQQVQELKQTKINKQRIQKGIKLLDRVKPGWENNINITAFKLSSPCDCIIGQVYGDYDQGVEELFGDASFNVSWTELLQYGFDCLFSQYSNVQQLWIDEINKRKETKQLI